MIIGLCYQHSHDINISLNTLDDALKIKDLLDSDRIHKTKETLVLTYGVVGNGGSVQTMLTLPSCSKTGRDQFSCMIDATRKTLKPDIIATDGDAMRRKLFNGRNKVILDRDVKTELEKLPLFDLHVIDGKYALYYDDKHNLIGCRLDFRVSLLSCPLVLRDHECCGQTSAMLVGVYTS